jgi:hypothetical protein
MSFQLFSLLLMLLLTAATIWGLYFVLNQLEVSLWFRKTILIGVFCWCTIQCLLAYSGYYSDPFTTSPARFLLAIIPLNFLMVYLLLTKVHLRHALALSVDHLAKLQLLRIPVQIIMLLLALQGKVPHQITIYGYNPDFFVGLSALALPALAMRPGKTGAIFQLCWGAIALVSTLLQPIFSVLSAPGPFQAFGLNVPNAGILEAPYILIPVAVFPLLVYGTIVIILQAIHKLRVGSSANIAPSNYMDTSEGSDPQLLSF